ncbi:MAG: hypothetical protein PHX21_02780 [bacterium]|nr:hypothetical protein [bacterium]
MKKLFNFLVFTIIVAFLYFLTILIDIRLANLGIERTLFSIIIIFFRTIILTFWGLGITYNKLWDKNTLNRKKSLAVWGIIVIIFFMFINTSLLILSKANKLYRYAKNPPCGWEGKIWQSDEILGFKSVPNATGLETFSLGGDIPIRFDKNGFRVPVSYDSTAEMKRPLLLFLGCSFTFGAVCLAEESFPYLVSESTKGYSINTGLCGGGLTQMLLLSKDLIPLYKPDFVIVQYSQWLTQRATSLGAPTYFSKIPTPYISKTKDGKNVISPRAFNSKTFEVNVDKFKKTKKGLKDYTCFLFEIGIPLYSYNGYYIITTILKKICGIVPSPNKDYKDVEQFVFSNIYEICKKNNSKMIILNLGDIQYSQNSHNLISPDSDIIFAEADSLLLCRLKSPDDYDKEYKHWYFNGKDSILKDPHPNQKAHKIIAETIIGSIKGKFTAEMQKKDTTIKPQRKKNNLELKEKQIIK